MASRCPVLLLCLSSITDPQTWQTTSNHLNLSRSPQRSISCILWFPPTSSTSSSPTISKQSPIYINLHGGGFVGGAAADNTEWCERIARECHCFVVSADYRLGPLHLFPAANDDCEDVLDAILESKPPFHELAIDRSRIAIGGDSAGGALALATASRSAYRSAIATTLCFYPVLDMTIDARQKKWVSSAPAPRFPDPIGFFLHDLVAEYAHRFDPRLISDSRLSPGLLSVEELPRSVHLFIAGTDILLAEEEKFVQRMHETEEGRKRVVVHRLPHLLHGYCNLDNRALKWLSGAEAVAEKEKSYLIALQAIRDALQGTE